MTRVARVRRLVLLGVGGAVVTAGIAWAAIPGGGGVFTGCYSTTSSPVGRLRVIDPSAGQACVAGENQITWNAKGINWTGTWSSATAYNIGDAVARNGSSYIAITANTNHPPPNSSWAILAQKGATGSTGPAGPAGPPGAMRAYGFIDTFTTPPTVKAVGHGITGVDFFNGIYCVYLDPSIDLASTTPLVTMANVSGAIVSARPNGCSNAGKAGIQVNISNASGAQVQGNLNATVVLQPNVPAKSPTLV